MRVAACSPPTDTAGPADAVGLVGDVADQRLSGIDALRGWAACSVVFTHAVWIYPLTVPAILATPLRLLALGVPLFFVISAFTLAHQYAGRLDDAGQCVTYAVRRLFRIAPLFYVMLAVWTLQLARTGTPLPSATAYLLDITFLFGCFPSTLDSIVPAGWSIGAEVIFYALLPVLLAPTRSVAGAATVLSLACGLAWAFNAHGAPPASVNSLRWFWVAFPTNAPYFAFGLLAFRIHEAVPKRARRDVAAASLIGGLGIALAMAALHPVLDIDVDRTVPIGFVTGWGTAFALVVLSQALAPARLIANRITGFLGTIRFSLYLVHPFVLLTQPIIPTIEATHLAPGVKLALALSLSLACSVPPAMLTYRLIEEPGRRLGRSLSQRLGPHRTR